MAYYLITFSPTGGTKRTAEILASAITEQWNPVNLLRPVPETNLTPDDICLIAVTSFGGRIPTTSAECLEKSKRTVQHVRFSYAYMATVRMRTRSANC